MAPENERSEARASRIGAGQTVLPPVSPVLPPFEQVRHLHRIGDPALSELGLEELLDELLVRIRDALSVDTAAILLLDEAGEHLVARAAKGLEEEVEVGVRIPLSQGFAGRIAAQRVPIFIADVDHADILNPILREKGVRSLLGVPLIVEGDVIGVLHVGSLRPRMFAQKDLAVLQLAAGRAAPAIERARLFDALEREHRVSVALQRSLLPDRPVELVGVEVATRYLPARDEVGGDWYDVIELPRGLIGLAIGDVVGHGIRAAALMGQLRTALRSYALEGHGPARTLELLDRFAQSIREQAMATAAYAIFDPETSLLRFSTAGQAPPVILRAHGARLLDATPAAPLGALPYGRYTEHQLRVAPGETVILYTDGLIEQPGTALREGIAQMLDVVAGAATPADAAEKLVRGLVPFDGPRDDVAIVALQNTPVPEELRLHLPADPKMLAQLRRVLRRWLRDRGATDREVMRITLAASEACANAIEHAYSPAPAAFALDASVVDGEVMLTVSDAGQWRAPRGQHRGRGLTIIDAAMDDVDVGPTEGGTRIVMRRRLETSG